MNRLPIHYEELETVYAATVGQGLRTLTIASAVAGEGVSMLAYALARRTASNGKRALLVDLNASRPSVAPRLGLSEAAWRPDSECWSHAVIECGASGLSVMPAPVGASGILRLRDADRFKELLKDWSTAFDVVVFDTSPLTSVNQGNVPAERIAALTDVTLMVVLAARTPETRVSEATERLRKANANLVGTILNDQHNPSVVEELCRETLRLNRRLPNFMSRCRTWFRSNPFLNQEI